MRLISLRARVHILFLNARLTCKSWILIFAQSIPDEQFHVVPLLLTVLQSLLYSARVRPRIQNAFIRILAFFQELCVGGGGVGEGARNPPASYPLSTWDQSPTFHCFLCEGYV